MSIFVQCSLFLYYINVTQQYIQNTLQICNTTMATQSTTTLPLYTLPILLVIKIALQSEHF